MFKIIGESLITRCEICHKDDQLCLYCERCQSNQGLAQLRTESFFKCLKSKFQFFALSNLRKMLSFKRLGYVLGFITLSLLVYSVFSFFSGREVIDDIEQVSMKCTALVPEGKLIQVKVARYHNVDQHSVILCSRQINVDENKSLGNFSIKHQLVVRKDQTNQIKSLQLNIGSNYDNDEDRKALVVKISQWLERAKPGESISFKIDWDSLKED